MFTYRNYTITNEEEHVMTGYTSDNQRVCCFAVDKVAVSTLRKCQLFWDKHKTSICIIIYKNITPSANKIAELNANIQLFPESAMVFDITEHNYVPEHRLSLHEHPEADKYPLILLSDPVVKFLGFHVGDIIEIRRPRREGHATQTYTVYYRRVIKG